MKPYAYTPFIAWSPSHSPPATEAKVVAFGQMAAGWRFGSGTPATSATVQRALDILDLLRLLGFAATDAFVGESGEILLTAYRREHTLEIYVEADGTYTFAEEEAEQEVDRHERISLPDLIALILKASKKLWPISGSYVAVITTKESSAFEVLRSATPPTAAAYPSSTSPASRVWGTRSVNTASNSIPA